MGDDCIFCKIAKSLPEDCIAETDMSYAIFDIKPITKGHSLVITKSHFENLGSTDEEHLMDAIVLAKKVASKLKEMYPDIRGFNYISNQGRAANQVVFHLHIHVIPKY